MITTQPAFRRIVRWGVVAPLVLAVSLSMLLVFSINVLLRDAEWVAHTHAIMTRAETAQKLAVDLETGLRGYQLTGDAAFLEPFKRGERRIKDEFTALLRQVAVAAQRERALEAQRRVQLWQEFAHEVIARRQRGEEVSSGTLNLRGKEMMDAARESFDIFLAGQEELLLQREETLDDLRWRFRFIGIPLLIGAGGVLAFFTHMQLRRVGETYDAVFNAFSRGEAELRSARDDLELKVKERTAELELANDRLKELDRLKSEFLATMSHELRTPLNSIIGFTGLLKEEMAGPVPAEQKEFLNMAYRSGKHLLNLINDLLDLSRIESGKMELYYEWFDPRNAVTEVLETVQPMVAEKQLALVKELQLPERLYSDQKKLFQILLNLVNNAVKFTERGEIRVTSRVEGERLHFEVADTGIGITSEQLQRLFEAFRQVEGSARRVYEGTGLGLYLSKKLVRLLGGQISATSEPGRGSKFSFWVPLLKGGQNGTATAAG